MKGGRGGGGGCPLLLTLQLNETNLNKVFVGGERPGTMRPRGGTGSSGVYRCANIPEVRNYLGTRRLPPGVRAALPLHAGPRFIQIKDKNKKILPPLLFSFLPPPDPPFRILVFRACFLSLFLFLSFSACP